MNARVFILCAVLCAPCAVQGASPGTGGWFFVMPGGPRGGAAAQVGATDSWGSEDSPSAPSGGWVAGTYHVKGLDGWDGDAGFYAYDIRAPLSPGEGKTWMVYFWATGEAPHTDREIQWGEWFSPSGDPLVIPRLECVQKPTGVTGGPEVGEVWTEPWMWIPLPYYATTDGLTGYGFRFTLRMVPEPGSLIVLGAGLAGMGASILRRRR